MSDPRVARFQKLVEQHPDNEMFRFSLAQALEAAGSTAAAEQHYRQCVAAKSDWMLPRILLGKLLLKAGEKDEAHRLFTDAHQLAIAQDHEDPAAELAALLADLKSFSGTRVTNSGDNA